MRFMDYMVVRVRRNEGTAISQYYVERERSLVANT
jgi:hypothetical protein